MQCEVVHKLIDLAVQIAASMASGASTALSNALTAKGSLLQVFSSVNILNGKRFSNAGLSWTGSSFVQNPEAGFDAAKFNWFQTLNNQYPTSIIKPFQEYSRELGKVDDKNKDQRPDEHLDPGKGTDPLCSDFEGDTKDLSQINTDKLMGIVTDEIDKLKKEEKKIFSKMYKGWIQQPGMPSMRAISFALREWYPLYGPESAKNPFHDAAEYESKIKERALKYIVGKAMSDDNTYLACMHVKDAQEQCKMDPAEQKSEHLRKYRKTQICPKPDDPELICQAARWHHTTDFQSHVQPMPGIDKIEHFKENDFHFRVKKLLQEAYDFYEIHRNNFTQAMSLVYDPDDSPVFHLPTCKGDDLRLHDLNPVHTFGKKSHLEFPFKCGDYKGNESAGFMNAMNARPGLRLFEEIEGIAGTRHPNALFWSRIPTVSFD